MFTLDNVASAAVYSLVGIVLIPLMLMIACGLFNAAV